MKRRTFIGALLCIAGGALGLRFLDDEDAATGGGSAAGVDTLQLLARSRVTAPSGTFRTEYAEASPGDFKTYDFRGARFLSYHDKDALYETNSFSNGSTPHQKNHRPIRIGHRTPGSGLAIVGGVVEGDQPASLTWIRMKYGQDIQRDTDAWIDDGSPRDVDPYRRVEDNHNQDGDPRFYLKPGGWAVVDGLRVRNTHDGLGLYGGAGPHHTGTVHVRNCYLQDIHDDGMENDEWQHLRVSDCLFERVYTLLSARPSLESLIRADQARQLQLLEDCVVRLWPFPGGHKRRSTDTSHDAIYKMDPNSPPLVLRRCVIQAEEFITPEAAVLPTRSRARGDLVTDAYQNVVIVWAGRGEYPGNVPNGCTVTHDRDVYLSAARNWMQRHGVSGFHDVDKARLLAPDPPPARQN